MKGKMRAARLPGFFPRDFWIVLGPYGSIKKHWAKHYGAFVVNHTFVYDKPVFSTSPLKERPSDPAIILINNCDLAVISQAIQLKWTSCYLSKKPAMKKPVKNMEYQTAECNYPAPLPRAPPPLAPAKPLTFGR